MRDWNVKKDIPKGVACPFCKDSNLGVKTPVSPLGWVLIIIGLFYIPLFGLGIILILIGANIKDKKFYCNNCEREF